MKVLLWPSDEGGCGQYRMLLPSADLRAGGMDITVDPRCEEVLVHWSRPWKDQPRDAEVTAVKPMDYDVLVIQRPLSKHHVDMIPFIQANGTAVVVELDDDFWSIHKNNASYDGMDPKQSPWFNHAHLARACRLADWVTVSTPALRKVVPSSRVSVIRNCVPESYLTEERHPEANWEIFENRPRLGWSGSPQTHPTDLQVMGTSIVDVTRATGSVFFSIGSMHTPSILGFDGGEAAYVQWVEFDRYASVVTGLDVGLVPLTMSRFNQGKSWLKGLEYAALGVPFVASPTDEYRLLHDMGAGDLASSSYKWWARTKRLLQNEEYRADRRGRGREVAGSWTYPSRSHEWAEAWERGVAHHAASPVPVP